MWWEASAFVAIAILVVSVVPVTAGVSVLWLDKAVHICEYLLLAAVLARAYLVSFRPSRMWPWLMATVFGALIELLQIALPWRSGDWIDCVYNGLGAFLGVVISVYLSGRVSSRV